MAQPKWLTQLEMARQAGVRGFILTGNTSDLVYYEGSPLVPCRVRYFIGQWLARDGYDVYLYSHARGLQRLQGSGDKQTVLREIADPRDLVQVLRAFSEWLRRRDARLALIVDYADHLCPISHGTNAVLAPEHLLALQTFHAWGTDDTIRAAENLVLLISHENQVNDLLVRTGSGYRVIWIDLPGEEERRGFTQLLQTIRGNGRARDFAALDSDFPLQEFVRTSGGLRLSDIEGLFRQAAAQGSSVSREMTRTLKAEVIRQLAGGLLEVREATHGLQHVAGLPHLKQFVQNLRWRWQQGAPDLPQAILLAGVPGCGKSFSVMAIAHELQIPCLAMRQVREQWVGASERNLERVLQIIETLAPCLVWIDEIDQALGQRSTGESADAGTSERMLARLWEFMGAMRHRGRILWVATTNRPDLLDAATLDRFPLVIPILHPTQAEVPELLRMLAQQVGRTLDFDPNGFAQLPNLGLPTVRALQEVVVKAGELADIAAGQVGAPITKDHLVQAAQLYKPNYNPLLHQFIALTAIRMTTFHDLFPWQNGVPMPEYLQPVLNEQGEIDPLRLANRLAELQQVLLHERIARQV